jgi:hypothetical protein
MKQSLLLTLITKVNEEGRKKSTLKPMLNWNKPNQLIAKINEL